MGEGSRDWVVSRVAEYSMCTQLICQVPICKNMRGFFTVLTILVVSLARVLSAPSSESVASPRCKGLRCRGAC